MIFLNKKGYCLLICKKGIIFANENCYITPCFLDFLVLYDDGDIDRIKHTCLKYYEDGCKQLISRIE